MFIRSFLVVATLLLLPSVCTAASVPPSNDHLDPKCPHGSHPGFETNIFQFNVPAETFFTKMGSFLHAEWYVGPLNFTHGKDNAVGSTRSGTFDGTFFTERLVEYARSSSQLRLRFILDNGPILFSGVTFHSYSEEMEIMSICGGGATYISFTAVYCEDKVGNGYDFYDKIRRRAVGAVADQLKALAFAGSCPISKH